MKLFACYCKTSLITAKLANWRDCPLLDQPVTCVDSTCTQTCLRGTVPSGSRQTRCRWNRRRSFHWGRVCNLYKVSFVTRSIQKLGPCVGCKPLEFHNSGLATHFNSTSTKRFTLRCANNELVNGRKRILFKCLCPRVDSIRLCSWQAKDSQLSPALRGYSCEASESFRLSMTSTSMLQVQLNQFCMDNSGDCGSRQQLRYARFSRDHWHCYKVHSCFQIKMVILILW